MMTISREKTAIHRSKVSVPTKWANANEHLNSTVYDWGCGRGKDSEWMRSEGLEVISYDPYHAPENAPETVDFSKIKTVVCNYVLNVIEDPQERIALLMNIFSRTAPGTSIVISVRSDVERNAQKSGWQKMGDGYVTSRDTFQKNYTTKDVVAFEEVFGKMVDILKTSGGITAIFTR